MMEKLIKTVLMVTCVFLAASSGKINAEPVPAANTPSLEEVRITLDKWIETQQILSKERKDWQQGKEILLGRLELVKKEIATLEEKNKEAEESVTEANKKRSELLAENDQDR